MSVENMERLNEIEERIVEVTTNQRVDIKKQLDWMKLKLNEHENRIVELKEEIKELRSTKQDASMHQSY